MLNVFTETSGIHHFSCLHCYVYSRGSSIDCTHSQQQFPSIISVVAQPCQSTQRNDPGECFVKFHCVMIMTIYDKGNMM